MPSGFGASKITEIASISTGEGSRFAGHYDGSGVASLGSSFQGASELIAGANLWGHEYATAEANNDAARKAIFGGTTSSFIDNDEPYMGTYHFADTNNTTRIGSTNVEVNPHHIYYQFVYAKSMNVSSQSRVYLGFYCRDQDSNFIDLRNCGGLSHTTLSQDLEDGDTYAYVTDASVFTATTDTYYFRNFLLFPPNHAKYFRPYFHTRIGYGSPTMYYSQRDTTLNRLRLSTNGNTDGSGDTTWSGGFIPAGTPVSRGAAGGTYNYCIASNPLVPYTYTHYDNKVNTTQYGQRNSSCNFRQGTKYINTMGLHNRASGPQMYLDNYYLTNLTDPGQVYAGNYNPDTKAYLQNHKFGPRFDKSGGVECSDLNEIVIPGHGGVFSYGKGIYRPSSLKCEIDPEDATCRGSLVSDTGGGIKIASGSTSYLVDLSGNGNNFELYGNPFMGYGTLKCDGTGDHMFRNSISYLGYYTYGIWMFLPDGSTASNGKIYLAESYRAAGGCWTTYSYINGGYARHQCYDNSGVGTEYVQSTSLVNDGVWHYIVAVMDKDSGTLRMYFDGRLEDTEAGVFNDGNYSSLQVGGAIGCLGDTSITGHIGCFQMYNEALTDDQIYHNYNYHWESRYKWLSDTTIRNNTLKDFGSMTFT